MQEKKNPKEQETVELVRILGKDLRSDKKIIVGLTKIKGISWSFSNAICHSLKIDSNKKIHELNQKDIENIHKFMTDVKTPSFLKNRQKDFETGKDSHLYGHDLSLRNEFDIKRLRKIKSYRGIRHTNKLPVRGQRTKSNFRPNRKKTGAVGVKKKKK